MSTPPGPCAARTGSTSAELLRHTHEHGDAFVTAYPRLAAPRAGTEFTADADILVLAALEDVIDADLACTISARVGVEGANLPTTPPARDVLADRATSLVPDFIANAGGIVAAAHSMDARYSPFRPRPRPIFSPISTRLRANAATVLDEPARHTPHRRTPPPACQPGRRVQRGHAAPRSGHSRPPPSNAFRP